MNKSHCKETLVLKIDFKKNKQLRKIFIYSHQMFIRHAEIFNRLQQKDKQPIKSFFSRCHKIPTTKKCFNNKLEWKLLSRKAVCGCLFLTSRIFTAHLIINH